MEFGVFDHLDRQGGSLADYYESRLRIAEAYDRAGFYAYHLAEHHSTPLGLAPSPSVFLAGVAQRTRKLRFGPLVWAMPMHHPLRLIEEICMLDQMSGGRLEIGFGRGSVPSSSNITAPIRPPRRRSTPRRSSWCSGIDPQGARLPRQAVFLQQGADGDRAAAEAASADLVRRARGRQRRAGGAPQPQRREPRPAGRDASLDRALPHHLAAGSPADDRLPQARPRPLHRGGADRRRGAGAGAAGLSGLARELYPSVPAARPLADRIRGRQPSICWPSADRGSPARRGRWRPFSSLSSPKPAATTWSGSSPSAI